MTRRPVDSRRATARVCGVAMGFSLALGAAACSASDTSSGGGRGGGTPVSVELTSSGCEASRLTAPAGKITFRVSGGGSGAVSELEVQRDGRILSERENLAPGLSGTFSVSLDPGSYTLYCPGGSGPATHDFTVTAAVPDPAPTTS